MPYVKSDGWPLVLPDDDGIRPAGSPDQCFYCHARVGQTHGEECVCVLSKWRAGVYLDYPGPRLGTHEEYLPYHWGEQDVDFRYNQGTWCSSNALDDIVWDAGTPPAEVVAIDHDKGCACSVVDFNSFECVDDGPFIFRRD